VHLSLFVARESGVPLVAFKLIECEVQLGLTLATALTVHYPARAPPGTSCGVAMALVSMSLSNAVASRWPSESAASRSVMPCVLEEKKALLSSRGPFREKNLSIPAAAGSSPSMPLLVFWPLLAPRRRHFSRLCALLLWCELYDMRDQQKERETSRLALNPRITPIVYVTTLA